MKNLFVFFSIVTIVFQTEAQTDKVEKIVTTNIVTSADWFRNVDGKLYNTQKSALWTNIQVNVLQATTNGLLIQTFTTEPIHEASTRTIATRNYLGHITSQRVVPTTVEVGSKKVPLQTILLRNYPTNLVGSVGKTMSIRAMRVGTTDHKGEVVELWDYGTPHRVVVVSTNRVKIH